MNTQPDPPALQFGRFTLVPGERRLLHDGEPTRLGSRAFDLLYALVSRPGQVVPKHDLLVTAWPGMVVEENNLHVQIAALRRVLGTEAIVTVSGRGYAFSAGTGITEIATAGSGLARTRAQFAAEATPLRGRAGETEALARLLRDFRIVTITGPAGVGKSRLAREVLERTGTAVTHIDLGTHVTDSLAICVAQAFAGSEGAATAALPSGGFLKRCAGTVLLENVERSPREAAEFADRLMAQSLLARLVCTSQVPLNMPGEQVLRLRPLPLPAAQETGRAATRNPAVQMLLDCAEAQNPESGRTFEAAQACTICRHLDGLPLALELAGQRIGLLGWRGVRRLLPRRFNLLRRSDGRAAERHRSLLASLEWSWSVLSDREREAMGRLCVHSGPLGMGAASRLLGDLVGSQWDAMDLVSTLVDRSMVIADTGSPASFHILESTRLFALQRRGERPA